MQNFQSFDSLGHQSPSGTPSDRNPDERQTKRTRTDFARGSSQGHDLGSRPDGNSIASGTQKPRTRAVTACKTCRARKTKCDGERPTCGYCTRTHGACEYDDAELQYSSLHVLGPQILDAIGNLTELVRQQQGQQQQVQNTYQYSNDAFTPASVSQAVYQDGSGPQCYQTGRCCYHAHSPSIQLASHISLRSAEDKSNSVSQKATLSRGLDSILRWKIFPQSLKTIPVDSGGDGPISHTLPPIDFAEIIKLEARYISVVHTKNPMLDLHMLRQNIAQVAENGLDWSIGTCLVALVCAIGSICREYNAESSDYIEYSTRKRDLEIALQYWGVASKRLGLAMSDSSLEAVQCVCLAGIWYMCNLQPLQAWKYFTMAGNSWYSTTLVRNSALKVGDVSQQDNSLSREQSTFFTAYKSELEIKFELAVNGSILEHLDYPYTFPVPPIFDTQISGDELSDNERTGWYFYLSEIAARHLINRVIEAQPTISNDPSAQEIQHMLNDLEIFDAQLQEWYGSLPPRMTFDLPDDSVQAARDEFHHILRSRYMFIRELCYRPFVQLCVNHTINAGPDLIAKVAAVASQGLQYCAYRLQSVGPQRTRNHGLWFVVRNSASCSMILIGAVRAQRNPLLNAASYLQIPVRWREQILRVLDLLSPFANERKGGVMECIQMVQWALSDFVT